MQSQILTYDDSTNYPIWTDIYGNILSASVVFGIIGMAIYSIIDAMFINKRVYRVFSILYSS
jgi:hypothetical protein